MAGQSRLSFVDCPYVLPSLITSTLHLLFHLFLYLWEVWLKLSSSEKLFISDGRGGSPYTNGKDTDMGI